MTKVTKPRTHSYRCQSMNNNNNVRHVSHTRTSGLRSSTSNNRPITHASVLTQTSLTSLGSTHCRRHASSHGKRCNSQVCSITPNQSTSPSGIDRVNSSRDLPKRNRSNNLAGTSKSRNSSINAFQRKYSAKSGNSTTSKKRSRSPVKSKRTKTTSRNSIRQVSKKRKPNTIPRRYSRSSATKVKTPKRQGKKSGKSGYSQKRTKSYNSGVVVESKVNSNASRKSSIKSKTGNYKNRKPANTRYNRKVRTMSRTSRKSKHSRNKSANTIKKQSNSIQKKVSSSHNNKELPRSKRLRNISANKIHSPTNKDIDGSKSIKKSESLSIKKSKSNQLNEIIEYSLKKLCSNIDTTLPTRNKSRTKSNKSVVKHQPTRTTRSNARRTITQRPFRSRSRLRSRNKSMPAGKPRKITQNRRSTTRNRRITGKPTSSPSLKTSKVSSSTLLDQQILSMKGFGPSIVHKLKNKGVTGQQGLKKKACEMTRYGFSRWFTAEVGGNKAQCRDLGRLFSTDFHRKPKKTTSAEENTADVAAKKVCYQFDCPSNTATMTHNDNRVQQEKSERIDNSAPMAPKMVQESTDVAGK